MTRCAPMWMWLPLLTACSGDSGDGSKVDARPAVVDASLGFDAPAADAAVFDAAPPDATAFIDAPQGAVACTFAVNAACNTNRSDYSCLETPYVDGWVREDVNNLDCPNGTGAGNCGSTTAPHVISVIRLCKTGSIGMPAPCTGAPLASAAGCAVCERTYLMCY